MKGKPLIEVLGHGGKRPNAGRKPASTPRKAITVRLSEPARNRLHQLKQDTGKSFTAILEAMLEIPA